MTTDDPEAAGTPPPASAHAPPCVMRCPNCAHQKALDQNPRRGLFVLCDSCLSILIIDDVRTKGGEALGVRVLAREDLDHMPSDVYQALCEEKMKRGRASGQLPGDLAALRKVLLELELPSGTVRPTLLQQGERELERVEELESKRPVWIRANRSRHTSLHLDIPGEGLACGQATQERVVVEVMAPGSKPCVLCMAELKRRPDLARYIDEALRQIDL